MKKQYKNIVIETAKAEKERIISERKAKNLTQTDVARFSGCSHQTVSAFENGKNDSFYLYMAYVTLIYGGEEI